MGNCRKYSKKYQGDGTRKRGKTDFGTESEEEKRKCMMGKREGEMNEERKGGNEDRGGKAEKAKRDGVGEENQSGGKRGGFEREEGEGRGRRRRRI